jgi:hypothetical protein
MDVVNTMHAVHNSSMTRTPHTTLPTPTERTYKSTAQRRTDALAALDDPTRATVSLSQAALLVGIAVSTACKCAETTGRLLDDLPVLRVTGTRRARYVVAKSELRRVLNLPAAPARRGAPDDGLVP